MEQKYIVKNQAAYSLSERIVQKLSLIESRLIWNTAFYIKMGDLTRAHMWANEVLYVRHIKASLKAE